MENVKVFFFYIKLVIAVREEMHSEILSLSVSLFLSPVLFSHSFSLSLDLFLASLSLCISLPHRLSLP